jgi:hypothetical protein
MVRGSTRTDAVEMRTYVRMVRIHRCPSRRGEVFSTSRDRDLVVMVGTMMVRQHVVHLPEKQKDHEHELPKKHHYAQYSGHCLSTLIQVDS